MAASVIGLAGDTITGTPPAPVIHKEWLPPPAIPTTPANPAGTVIWPKELYPAVTTVPSFRSASEYPPAEAAEMATTPAHPDTVAW